MLRSNSNSIFLLVFKWKGCYFLVWFKVHIVRIINFIFNGEGWPSKPSSNLVSFRFFLSIRLWLDSCVKCQLVVDVFFGRIKCKNQLFSLKGDVQSTIHLSTFFFVWPLSKFHWKIKPFSFHRDSFYTFRRKK